jgi:serine/threonine protein kinase
MDYCDLGTLEDQYADVCCSEDRLWRILAQVASGLDYLHGHGILHLDIKPANLLAAEDGNVKIGDFGIACMTTNTSPTEDGSSDLDVSIDANNESYMEGDNRYMAPEVLEDRFSFAADVFSLGISLLELATNINLPQQGLQWHALRDRSFFSTPCVESLSPTAVDHDGRTDDSWLCKQYNLSPDLVELLKGMMDPSPESRLQLSDVLRHKQVKEQLAKLEQDLVLMSGTGADGEESYFCLDAGCGDTNEDVDFHLRNRERIERSARLSRYGRSIAASGPGGSAKAPRISEGGVAVVIDLAEKDEDDVGSQPDDVSDEDEDRGVAVARLIFGADDGAEEIGPLGNDRGDFSDDDHDMSLADDFDDVPMDHPGTEERTSDSERSAIRNLLDDFDLSSSN